MRFIIILITVLRFESIDMDCGSPPLPHSTNALMIGNTSHFAERYEEYSVVRYECDFEGQELVGDSTLRCFNGRWVGKPPKCATPTKSLIKKFGLSDQMNGKRMTYIILKRSFTDCYNKGHKWNITSSQKLLFEVETKSPVDYFSLILFSKDLVKSWMNGDLVVMARIERPRKQCIIEKFELIGLHSNKTKISFKCFKSFGEISIYDLNPLDDDFIQMISFDFESKMKIAIKYCSLKTFSFSDSCGSPERPLHSIEVMKEKKFVEFSCEEDFYLEPINGHKVICGSLGDWNKIFPQCLAKTTCDLPAMDRIDHYIHVKYKNLNYLNGTPYAETNSIAIYSCRSGNQTDIELIGDHKRICIKSFWSGSQPKCSKILRKAIKISEYRDHPNVTNTDSSAAHNDSNWHKFNLIVISMLVSFLIGAAFIGFIVFVLMKYMNGWRSQTINSTTEHIPSVVVSEPNHYYERNSYEEFRYESLRINSFELLDLQRINSLYQTSN